MAEVPVMRLPDYLVNDPGLLTIPRDRLRDLQGERLRAMVRYVYERSPFWREKLEQVGTAPEDVRGVDDIGRLPTCTKQELQREQEEHPPLGRYVCTDRAEWVRFFATSGTTGRPLRRVFSARDWGYMIDRFTRQSPWTPDDVILLTLPIDGAAGPTAGMEAAAHAGALVIAGGLWSTERKIDTMVSLRPTSITGSTSYLLHLTEVARKKGIDLSSLGVRTVACIGEPGAALDSTRAKISGRFGGAAVTDGYGMTEVFPLGGNCAFDRSIHLAEDIVLVECLRPGGNEPVEPGELGELVYTNIVGDTQPLLRYRSGDLGRLSDGSPCGCGVTHLRIQGSVEGRADDMIWYRGANFFPSAVESAISSVEGVASEHQIVLTDDDAGFPHLTVRVEREDTRDDTRQYVAASAHQIGSALGIALKEALGVTAEVEVLPSGALPRPSPGAKARRVLDQRHQSNRTEEAR
ncbi:MAG: AMP-binding protein [Streptosporangiales bacterium]|nr:AMP-binding protein [Streptosporangiales bacterium]